MSDFGIRFRQSDGFELFNTNTIGAFKLITAGSYMTTPPVIYRSNLGALNAAGRLFVGVPTWELSIFDPSTPANPQKPWRVEGNNLILPVAGGFVPTPYVVCYI